VVERWLAASSWTWNGDPKLDVAYGEAVELAAAAAGIYCLASAS